MKLSYCFTLSSPLFSSALGRMNPNQFMKDRYDHLSTRGWKEMWDVYNDPLWSTSDVTMRYPVEEYLDHDEAHQKVGEALKEILADPGYLVVDVRDEKDIQAYDLIHKYEEDKVDLKADYMKFPYDSIKTDPYHYIARVAHKSAKSGKISEQEETEVMVHLKRNKEDPVNISEDLRNVKILILCNWENCGCRWGFSRWHGFNHVETMSMVNSYFPGGMHDAWNFVPVSEMSAEEWSRRLQQGGLMDKISFGRDDQKK